LAAETQKAAEFQKISKSESYFHASRQGSSKIGDKKLEESLV
jgi:hypothetical protein